MTKSKFTHDDSSARRDAHLKRALDEARALADPQRAYGPGWSAHAARTGDLSALALPRD
jgi:hypothetical protein